MPKSALSIATIQLPNSRYGEISVAHIEQPYGDFSSPVVSIGISLEGDDDHDWKVHLPYEKLDEVIKALEEARDMSDTMPRNDKHYLDLHAEIGGGA
ncbi:MULTISPECIES: hypothetical protein [Sulfurimonas]|uniref:Uncharacterized protein n=1 Tax=Sulfurimonas sediminis TaxID=2590020 RepID=A0A7M1B055_9BACT|nr:MULTISPECIES: hypothetical protein [Sulfurimonas]QOP43101.1 hypothetical protein FJR45_03690 [Sulfurimonas sediminis]UCN00990.1 hypothetical protein LCX93_03475 [Sulfurimonas sp. SWIR-19]